MKMKHLFLGVLATLALGTFATAAEVPTKGDVYAVVFEPGMTPTVAEQPHTGRYCGQWLNNGKQDGLIVFKLQRGLTFSDIPAEERVAAECNPTMKTFYKKAKTKLAEQAWYSQTPAMRHMLTHPIPRIPHYPRLPRDIKMPSGPPIKK